MIVGCLGLDDLGAQIATRVLDRHRLIVHDSDPTRVERLTALGATGGVDAREVAARSDVVILCPASPGKVHGRVLGEGGFAEALRPGAVVIDQGAGDPGSTRALAAELGQLDIGLVDALVIGTPADVKAGEAMIVVGASASQLEQVRPVLAAVGPQVIHAGEVGTAMAMRIVAGALAATHRALSLESLALASIRGIPPARAVEIVVAGSGRNHYLAGVVESGLFSGRPSDSPSLGVARDDIDAACRLAVTSGVPMFLGNRVDAFYQACVRELGADVGADAAALVMDRLAGSRVVPLHGESQEADQHD